MKTQAVPFPKSGFSVTTRRQADGVLIEIRGELDLANADAVERAIRDAEDTEIGAIVVDLSEMSFVDSTGLSVLLRARSRDRELADRLRFRPSRHGGVSRLLALTGTRDLLAS
jgi:anti-anti-sigma factor